MTIHQTHPHFMKRNHILSGFLLSACCMITTLSARVDPLDQAKQNIEQFRKGAISIQLTDTQGHPLEGVTVHIEQQSHDFIFGSIVFELTREDFLTPEQEVGYKEKFSRLFNMAIFPFYWEGYEAKAGHPTWQKIEEVVEWCLSRGIRPKGHPLAWTHFAGTPPWLYDIPADYGTTLLKARIIENVLGYKGQIDIWDVVNEASNTIPWEAALKEPERINDKRYGGYENSVQTVADWVVPCYEWAYTSNPDATLILNDFGQIAFPPIRQRFYDLVKELQSRNTPLHGIGLQAHEPRLEWYDTEEVWDTLELYRELNLPIHFTEFHPHSAGAQIEGGYREGNWTPETQAAYAEQMLTLAFGHPSVVSFCWWDFTENDSYIKGSALLNQDLSPKPAYTVLDRLINHDWKTHEQTQTDSDGHITLRGFYGDYVISVSLANGEEQSFNFSHTPDKTSSWNLQIDH
jgi:endo-1,4-beta-xylanase